MILGRSAPASLLLIKRVLRPLLCNPVLAIPVKGGSYTRSWRQRRLVHCVPQLSS